MSSKEDEIIGHCIYYLESPNTAGNKAKDCIQELDSLLWDVEEG